MTKKILWSTQGGNFNTDYTSKVETALPDLGATKNMTWNLHMDDLQDNKSYNI